jgi:hypothetical protein
LGLNRNGQDYQLSEDVVSFARKGIARFDGMLNKSAAFGAAAAVQVLARDCGWDHSAFLEIGVYKGKFFSLIERATRGTNCRLFGVDPFNLENQSIDDVLRSFHDEGMETNRIEFHVGLSSDGTAIKRMIGDRRLLLSHVDGSHEHDAVCADLVFLDEIIDAHGIVNADDFWNRHTLGVTSAIFRLLIENRLRICPFMLCNTKLFFCHPDNAAHLQQLFLRVFADNPDVTLFKEYMELRQSEKWWLSKQRLVSHEIIVI